MLVILVWAPFVGAADYFGDLATIGTLALILVYGGVTAAELAESLRARRLVRAGLSLSAMLVLAWPLYNSIWPIPDSPRSLWPYIVIVWIVVGLLLLAFRPALGHNSSPNRRSSQFQRADEAAFSPVNQSLPPRCPIELSGMIAMTVNEYEGRFQNSAPSWHQMLIEMQSPKRTRRRRWRYVIAAVLLILTTLTTQIAPRHPAQSDVAGRTGRERGFDTARRDFWHILDRLRRG